MDTNKLAKSIVDKATKNQAAVELGRKGGLVGGRRRAEKLSKERRSEIAKEAAKARWASKDK